MLRNARHSKILALIEEKEIETQEELCKELSEANFKVTQATVSRDVRELRLFKVAGIKKRYRYAANKKYKNMLPEKLLLLFEAGVESIASVGNIVITKTLPGNGMNAGAVIDRMDHPDIVGSISGDDTVFSVCKTPEAALDVKERLIQMARLNNVKETQHS